MTLGCRLRVSGVAVAALLGGAGCGAARRPVSDDTLLVSKLLRVPDPTFVRAEGYDALGELKSWEALYARTLARARTEAGRSDESLRRFLMLGFVARARADAAMSESATTDLMPLYLSRRNEVLRILLELPFLAPSTCYYLGAFFGFEDQSAADKEPFLEENRPVIERSLGPQEASICFESIGGSVPQP